MTRKPVITKWSAAEARERTARRLAVIEELLLLIGADWDHVDHPPVTAHCDALIAGGVQELRDALERSRLAETAPGPRHG